MAQVLGLGGKDQSAGFEGSVQARGMFGQSLMVGELRRQYLGVEVRLKVLRLRGAEDPAVGQDRQQRRDGEAADQDGPDGLFFEQRQHQRGAPGLPGRVATPPGGDEVDCPGARVQRRVNAVARRSRNGSRRDVSI